MKIFIQEVRTGEYYSGDQEWSRDTGDAYAFSSSIAALNFCQQMEREQPENQFIMRFDIMCAFGALRPEWAVRLGALGALTPPA